VSYRRLTSRPNVPYLKKLAAEQYPGLAVGHAQARIAARFGFRGWDRMVRFIGAAHRARMEIHAAARSGASQALLRKVRRSWPGLFFAVGDASPDLLRTLLEWGVDPNASDFYGDTLLHWAAANQPLATIAESITLLLDAGADGDRVNLHDEWPLDVLHARRDWKAAGASALVNLEWRLSSYLPMDGDDDWMCDDE
jgi:hypothetical protein